MAGVATEITHKEGRYRFREIYDKREKVDSGEIQTRPLVPLVTPND